MKYLWIVFVVVGALAATALVGFFISRGTRNRVPDFALTERSGAPLTRKDLLGKVWVGEFIFTRCAGACPVMVSRMMGVYKKFPQATYLSVSVDPAYDTPEVLRAYQKNNSLPPEWLFATGDDAAIQNLMKKGFLLSMGPGSSQEERIIHSDRLVLVDRYGRNRGTYTTSTMEGMGDLEEQLAKVLAEPELPVRKLPAVNAALNGTAGALLLIGLVFIKAKKQGAHKACMLAALASSSLFLVSYLTAHHYLGATPYQGGHRTLYLSILISHTVLAALVVPLALVTVYRAYQGAFDRHRAIASWTFPIWLYVSVTGVVIYFMLY